jgi:hypothetical protein
MHIAIIKIMVSFYQRLLKMQHNRSIDYSK